MDLPKEAESTSNQPGEHACMVVGIGGDVGLAEGAGHRHRSLIKYSWTTLLLDNYRSRSGWKQQDPTGNHIVYKIPSRECVSNQQL